LKIAVVVVMLVLAFAVAVAAFWLWTPDRDRATLEAKYLNSTADMIEVAGVRLHVRDSGPKAAPAVVFIHGFGGSLHSWETWAQGLAATHRVIRFDLPGSGLSAPDPTGDYTDARTMKLLIALMDRLGVARADVVGHSIGGRMAWTFAATHPERVNKLVLVSPDGFASPGFVYGSAPEVPGTVKLMRWALPKALLKMSLAPAYGNPQFMTDALATQYHDLMLAPGSRGALIARMQQTVLVDPLPLLKRIQAPTLLVWGEADGMIPFANSADYLKAISNVKLAAFKGIGHLPQEEAATESLKAVLEFLR
jgi:pimeloyl-ACP methyl ester carboxylesterase